LAYSFRYLERLHLLDNIAQIAEYSDHFEDTPTLRKMVLDEQTIRHLDITEIEGQSRRSTEGSFLHHFDQHTVTPFGKRLMRRWVVNPLATADHINLRLDAV